MAGSSFEDQEFEFSTFAKNIKSFKIKLNSTDKVDDIITKVSSYLKYNKEDINIYLNDKLLDNMGVTLGEVIEGNKRQEFVVDLKGSFRFRCRWDSEEFQLKFDPVAIKKVGDAKRELQKYLNNMNLQIYLGDSEKPLKNTAELSKLNISDETVFNLDLSKDSIKTFNFKLMTDNSVLKLDFNPNITIGEVKEQLADHLDVDDNKIDIMFAGKFRENCQTLKDLNIPPRGQITVYVQETEPICLMTCEALKYYYSPEEEAFPEKSNETDVISVMKESITKYDYSKPETFRDITVKDFIKQYMKKSASRNTLFVALTSEQKVNSDDMTINLRDKTNTKILSLDMKQELVANCKMCDLILKIKEQVAIPDQCFFCFLDLIAQKFQEIRRNKKIFAITEITLNTN